VLTVTDNKGAQDTDARTVTVSSSTAGLSFVGESHTEGNATRWSVTAPSGLRVGDAMILALSTSASAPSNPTGTGWTLIDTRTAATLTSKVWSKIATTTDVGSTVTITSSTTAKSVLDLLGYRGTRTPPVAAFADRGETVSSTTHVTPTLTAPAGGGWVVSMWMEKSSTTTSLSPPAGVVQRYRGCGTSGGHTCLLVADGATTVSGGSTVGGLTATADSASGVDAMWTLVLGPS
jgi:hypothetical protein